MKLKTRKAYTQSVLSEKGKTFKESYLTPKGKRLLAEGKITKEEANNKYRKNRYVTNPNASVITHIKHEDRYNYEEKDSNYYKKHNS